MIGYCLTYQGRPHFKSDKKGVSKANANIAFAEYRRKQRQTVSDHRVELGKKNF